MRGGATSPAFSALMSATTFSLGAMMGSRRGDLPEALLRRFCITKLVTVIRLIGCLRQCCATQISMGPRRLDCNTYEGENERIVRVCRASHRVRSDTLWRIRFRKRTKIKPNSNRNHKKSHVGTRIKNQNQVKQVGNPM